MGLTAGRHPMALRRDDLALRGILRACDLYTTRQGRRVRVAGMVITRQRPGTAKGFVFLTLEDETGIANIIVRPDVFAQERLTIIEEPFLIVDGVLQNQDGVTSVRAEQMSGLKGLDVDFDAHDLYQPLTTNVPDRSATKTRRHETKPPPFFVLSCLRGSSNPPSLSANVPDRSATKTRRHETKTTAV